MSSKEVYLKKPQFEEMTSFIKAVLQLYPIGAMIQNNKTMQETLEFLAGLLW